MYKTNSNKSLWFRFVNWGYVMYSNWVVTYAPRALLPIVIRIDRKWLYYIISLSVYDWPDENSEEEL